MSQPDQARPEHKYWHNVMKVLGGTMMAQAVPLLIMPVLTRIVAPADMGMYGTWVGIVAIVSIIFIMRLDVLLPIVASNADRRIGMSIATRMSLWLSLACVAILLILQPQMAVWVQGWTWWSSVALGLGGLGLATNLMWRGCATGAGDFGAINIMRLATALSIAAGQLIGALTVGGGPGMVWGYVIGTGIGVWAGRRRLAGPLHQNDDGSVATVTAAQRREFAAQNFRVPLFALPAELLNNICQALPIILLGARFGAGDAGLFALMMRTVDAPAMIFSLAVQDVYKRRAAEEFRRLGNCRAALLDTLRVLALVAIAPALVLALAGPYLFGLVYGADWEQSGMIAQFLAPMIYLRFFVSPLGYTLYITGHGQRALWWQVALLLMTLGAFLLPGQSVEAFVAYSAGYTVLYAIYLLLIYRSACGDTAVAHAKESTS